MQKYSDQFKQAVAQAQTIQKRSRETNLPIAEPLDHALEQLLTASEALLTTEAKLHQREEALLQAQRSAEAEQQRYRQLFDFAPDGYLVTSLDGTIKMANRVAAAMLNIDAEYLIRKPLAVYIAQDQRRFFRQKMNRLRTMGASESWEARLQPRHQPPMDVMIAVVRSVSPLADSDEILWQLRDVTAYKLKEQQEREQFFRDTFEQSPVGMGLIDSNGEWLHVNVKLCEMFGYTPDEFGKLPFLDMIFRDDHDVMQELISRLRSGELDKVKHETSFIQKNGERIWTLVNVSPRRSPASEFLYNIVVVEDITERKRIEEEEREQRLIAEVLRDTALILASTLDFSEVTDQILMNIGRLVPHDAASFLLIEDDSAYVARAHGYDPSLETGLRAFHIAVAESDRITQMLQTKSPVLIPHWEEHGVWDRISGMEWMRSLVAAPILDGEVVIGFLKLHSRTPNFFTAEHAKLLQVFAAQVAIAIRNARAHEQVQSLAILNERHRLARELHDAVTQTLFSANVIADSVPRLWQNIPTPVQTQLQQLQMLTRGALAEMRTLLLELRPEYLAHIDLEAQIRQLLDAVKARKVIEADFTEQVEIPIPVPVRIAFYRIAQEALNNVVKHAHASHIRIVLISQDNCAQLVVEDNGIGFDVKNKPAGFGLDTMSERAEEISAQLDVITIPQVGTKVTVIWETPRED